MSYEPRQTSQKRKTELESEGTKPKVEDQARAESLEPKAQSLEPRA